MLTKLNISHFQNFKWYICSLFLLCRKFNSSKFRIFKIIKFQRFKVTLFQYVEISNYQKNQNTIVCVYFPCFQTFKFSEIHVCFVFQNDEFSKFQISKTKIKVSAIQHKLILFSKCSELWFLNFKISTYTARRPFWSTPKT